MDYYVGAYRIVLHRRAFFPLASSRNRISARTAANSAEDESLPAFTGKK